MKKSKNRTHLSHRLSGCRALRQVQPQPCGAGILGIGIQLAVPSAAEGGAGEVRHGGTDDPR